MMDGELGARFVAYGRVRMMRVLSQVDVSLFQTGWGARARCLPAGAVVKSSIRREWTWN